MNKTKAFLNEIIVENMYFNQEKNAREVLQGSVETVMELTKEANKLMHALMTTDKYFAESLKLKALEEDLEALRCKYEEINMDVYYKSKGTTREEALAEYNKMVASIRERV